MKDVNRKTATPGGGRNRLLPGMLAAICLVGVVWLFSQGGEPENVEPFTLQGELIESTIEGHGEEVGEGVPRRRRERYKPGSLPQRLVQSNYRMVKAGKTNMNDISVAPTNLSANVAMFTNVVKWDTSLVEDEQGYVNVGFDLLASFDFQLGGDVAEKGNNTALASERIQSRIPAEVRELHQRRVRLRGYLVPVSMDEGKAVEFLLMKDQTLCCFGTIPKVNEWVHVKVSGEGVEPRMDIPVTTKGVLRVGDQWEQGYFAGLYLLHADASEFVKE